MPHTPLLLSLADIAALARVQRPVVTTWRRRHPDFPDPVTENGPRPWFDGSEVADWLATTGLGNTPDGDLHAEVALHGLIHHAGELGAERLVSVIGALLFLRHLDERPLAGATAETLVERAERVDFDDEFALRELRENRGATSRAAPLAEDLIEAAYTPGGAHEQLMAGRHRLGLTGLATGHLSREARRLVVRVADAARRTAERGVLTVADPHALCGDLLYDAVATAEDPSGVRVLAAEHDERLARLTRRRLLLAGVAELNLDVQVGGELEERLADPDLVVTVLPYQAGEHRSRLRTLEEVESLGDLLGPGRTAVVLGPADPLVEGLTDPDEAQTRARLLRSGLVESVVTLPGGVDPYRPGYSCAMWTLTRPHHESPTRGHVLLCDIGTEPMEAGVCDRLAEDVLLWRAEGKRLEGHAPRYGHAVPIRELEAKFGAPLLPTGPSESTRLSDVAEERPALIAEAETRLARAEARARDHTVGSGPLRGDLVRRVTDHPATTTVGGLRAEGRITLVKGHRIAQGHVGPRGQFDVLGPEEILGRARRGARRVDRVVLATEYTHADLTEPGDVVYTAGPEFGALVDEDGFSVVTFPARVLRVNRDARRPLTPRVLALLLNAAPAGRRAPGAVRPSRSPEDIPLPDLPPAEVRRLDTLLGEVERRRALLDAQYTELDGILDLATSGLADGTLTVSRT